MGRREKVDDGTNVTDLVCNNESAIPEEPASQPSFQHHLFSSKSEIIQRTIPFSIDFFSRIRGNSYLNRVECFLNASSERLIRPNSSDNENHLANRDECSLPARLTGIELYSCLGWVRMKGGADKSGVDCSSYSYQYSTSNRLIMCE